MAKAIITLTTDFGTASPYAAAMKGVILSLQPAAQLIDLTHAIPPQDVWHAAFFLAEAIPCFPAEAIHVVVVDPGVGTARRLLYAEVGPHRLLLPDNGLLTILAESLGMRRAFHLQEPRFWRQPVSSTFHGRDILAPVAARLSLGMDPEELGPVVTDLVNLPVPKPVITHATIEGEVLWVDSFGNLLTNIRHELLGASAPQVLIGTRGPLPWVRTYGDARAGELVALVSSGGYLEVAVVQGNAAQLLGVRRGAQVTVRF